MLEKRKTWVFGVVVLALVFSASRDAEASEELPLSACVDAVGTYLTKNFASDRSGKSVSRSLLTLTNGGQAFFTDSREVGSQVYAPFTDGRGAWRCLSASQGESTMAITVLDFTLVETGGRRQAIARLDMQAERGPDPGSIRGTITLYFVPLDGDPLNVEALGEGRVFRFEGLRVKPL